MSDSEEKQDIVLLVPEGFSLTDPENVSEIHYKSFKRPKFDLARNPLLQSEKVFTRIILSLRDVSEAATCLKILQGERAHESEHTSLPSRETIVENGLIISYCRPFSKSVSGDIPFSFRRFGIRLPPETKTLHRRILEFRDKHVAHSDSEYVHRKVFERKINFKDGTIHITSPPNFSFSPRFSSFERSQINDHVQTLWHFLIEVYSEMCGIHGYPRPNIKIESIDNVTRFGSDKLGPDTMGLEDLATKLREHLEKRSNSS